MYDTIIKGGTIVDGTGAPSFVGDIAITDGKIAAVGQVSGSARETINATGLLVTPGWVDIHTHYDGQVTWDPLLAPSFHHGVTTVVMGNCGVGFAPVRPEQRDTLISLMEAVEDIPGSALSEGIRWEWESFPEYLDAIDRLPHAIDYAALVAHGPLRLYVMGERGARNEAATPEDIAEMERLTREAMAAGAIGLSTSRTLLHRTPDGEPVPGTFAAPDELMALGRAIADSGHGVLEVVPAGVSSEGDVSPLTELAWMREIALKTGCPMSFILFQAHADPERWREQAKALAAARAEGAKITAQVPGRAVGTLLGLSSNSHAFVFSRIWADRLAKLSLAERIQLLKSDENVRRQVATEAIGGEGENSAVEVPNWMRPMATNWARMYRLGASPNYEPSYNDSVAGIAEATDRDPRAVALDLMLERNGEGLILLPFTNYAEGNLDVALEMLSDPSTVIGVSDGGAHVSSICDASVPTFMLTHWVRDRNGARLPLEYVVRKQSRDTAESFGINDRGQLLSGLRADINVIDFERLALEAPEMIFDLPGGAQRLMQESRGYVATLVAGEVIRRNDVDTGARPGRLLRSRPA